MRKGFCKASSRSWHLSGLPTLSAPVSHRGDSVDDSCTGTIVATQWGDLADLPYADDTRLVMGVSAAHVGELAIAIEQVGIDTDCRRYRRVLMIVFDALMSVLF